MEVRRMVAIGDLGEAGQIELQVWRERRTLEQAGGRAGTIFQKGEADAEADLRKPLEALAARVLRPLESHIGKTPRWLISPDGLLWLVPWSALPLGGRYVVEGHPGSHLVSGRALVAVPAVGKPGRAA